jgi:MFS family permease
MGARPLSTRPAADRGAASRLFWRFWTAATVSAVGSAVTVVALPLVAVTLLDVSALQTTLLAAAGQVSWLVLGLPAGVIVQRYPLRHLQVVMDVTRMLAIGSIPVAWWLGLLTYPHLLLSALVIGLATVLFDIGGSTYLPAIIDKEELNSRNSVVSGTHAVTQIGGQSLGGLLVQLTGPVGVLLVDAVSYLASAGTLATLPEHRTDPQPRTRAMRMIREGWTFVVRHPVMLPCMMWATAANFFTAALVALTPLYLVRETGVSSTVVGIVFAADGAGTLLGSIVASRLAARLGTARAVLAATLAGGLLALAIPLTTGVGNVYFFVVGNAGLGAGIVIGSILTRTHRQTDSPPELLSRVMATVRFVSWGALPLGAALSGVLATAVGLRPALWAVCAGALIGPLILLSSPLRGRRDLSSHPQDQSPPPTGS